MVITAKEPEKYDLEVFLGKREDWFCCGLSCDDKGEAGCGKSRTVAEILFPASGLAASRCVLGWW